MSRLTGEISIEQIDEWFQIGKKSVQVESIPRSITTGRDFDTKTQRPVEIRAQRYVPSYQRNPKGLSSQTDYAKEYQEEEAANLMHYSQPQMHGLDDVSETMSALDLETIVTGSVAMPDDLVPSNANDVYNNYKFDHQYPEQLPITQYKDQVIATIESNQVTVIQGSTGSGKTTQVPQYILDHYAKNNKYVNIVVTQPRRIAAMSIARRVCSERDWQIGTVCGYQVGLDKTASDDTRILYVTTGVLLRKLINTKNMLQFTHVILDEVHERDQDTDFSLLVVRKLLRTNSRHVKVILMSATIDSDLFAQYFALPVYDRLEPAPVVNVEGMVYNVSEYYADDLASLGVVPDVDSSRPGVSPEAQDLAVALIQYFDKMESKEQHLDKSPSKDRSLYRNTVLVFLPGLGEINSMYEQLQGLAIHHELILIPLHSTITLEEQARVFEMPRDGRRKVILSTNIAESSITVPDIKYVIDFCLTKNLISDPDTNYTSLQVEWASKANCIQRKGRAGRVTNGRVYRMVPKLFYENCIQDYGIPEMQRCPLEQLILQVKVLDLGEPKAILALALSPPNLDDIEKTILLLKEVGALTTPSTYTGNRHDGQLTFVGRVLADLPVDIRIGKLMVLGHVFGLLPECLIIGAAMSLKSIFSKPFKKHLEAYRHKMDWANGSCSDCVAILNAYQEWDKKTKMGEFRRTGQREKDWANKQFLQIRRLREISELVKELEQRLYKFNIQPPKQQPNYKRNFTTDQEKLLFKITGQPKTALVISPLRALMLDQLEFLKNHHVKTAAIMKDMPAQSVLDVKFGNVQVVFASPESIVHKDWLRMLQQGPLRDQMCVLLVLCGAFYPNYFLKSEIDEQESLRSMSGQDPFNTVMVKGLPANQGALYKDSLQTQFRDVGHQPNVFFEETRAYISFKWKHEYQGKVHPGVYSAVKLRHLRLPVELTLYSNEEAHALMQKLHKSQAQGQGGQRRLRSNRILSDGMLDTPRLQVEPPDATRQAVMLFVTETKSCGHFWAQYGETKNFEDLHAVHMRLNMGNLELLSGPVALGTYCVAPFTDETTEWYRARVDHVERIFDRNRNIWTEIVEVFFVDYGNTEKVRREDLRCMPEEIKAYPFQAVECMLKGIRPSAVKCPDGKWTEEANKKFKAMVSSKQLYGQIYSIVRDVLRLELFEVFPNGTQLFVNDELIKMGYADTAEEGFLSKQNHEARLTMATSSATRLAAESSATLENPTYDWINATLVANQGPVLSGKSKRSSKVRLTGPNNPYEMNFYSMTNVGRMRSVRIEPDSVNSVAIDDEPQDPHDRLMCASFVGLNPSGSSMIARDTTIMPLIPGLPSLIALLFAPMAELRTDPDKTRYIGAICGLGEDRHAPGYPAFPDHDMEITFDVKIDIEDIYKINGVRMAINLAIGSQDQICSWGSDAIHKIQDSARKKLMDLIQKRRDPVEAMGYNRPYKWNEVDQDDIIYHNLDETSGDCPMLLNLHNCVMLVDEQDDSDEEQAAINNKEQLKQHAKWLRKIAKDNSKRDPVRCLLCRKDFPTRQLMATHLETRTHINREEALYDS